jgi:hypothetical protein
MPDTRWSALRPFLVPGIVLWVFVVVAFGVLGALNAWGAGLTTGDEPHYLILADSIAHEHSLQPEDAYRRDASSNSPLLPVAGVGQSVISANAAHLVEGPNGWYSVHGVGLPTLMAPAVAIGGAPGARALLIVIAAAVVALLWVFAGVFFVSRRDRAMAVAPLCISLPLLSGASQIYPDLVGGGVCLLGLFTLVQVQRGKRSWRVLGAVVALAFLPWLHLRFAIPSLILVAAIVWARSRHAGWGWTAFALAAPWTASVMLLAFYNWWAFGNPSGPYGDDAASASWHSVMVFFGLVTDQNQGILFQPLHLVGLLFVVAFVREHRVLAVTMLLVAVSILVPNAVHPTWYGGYSYSGRFGWAVSVILLPMTLFGLSRLALLARHVFVAVSLLAGVMQIWFIHDLLHGFLPLINRPDTTPLDRYSIHFGSLGRWLPALYDPHTALGHVPNAVALVVIGWIVVLGTWWSERDEAPRRVSA